MCQAPSPRTRDDGCPHAAVSRSSLRTLRLHYLAWSRKSLQLVKARLNFSARTLMPSARRERRHASGNSNTLQVSRHSPRSPCSCSDLLPCLMCWDRAAGAAPRARQACGRAGGPFRHLFSSHRKWSSTASHLDGPPTLALPPDGERAQLFCKY